MMLHPSPISRVPEETARIAQAAIPPGNAFMQMRDVLGSIYTDEQFADLFGTRGRPAWPPNAKLTAWRRRCKAGVRR